MEKIKFYKNCWELGSGTEGALRSTIIFWNQNIISRTPISNDGDIINKKYKLLKDNFTLIISNIMPQKNSFWWRFSRIEYQVKNPFLGIQVGLL